MTRGAVVIGWGVAAVVLSGFLGVADCGTSRYRSVSGRTQTVSIVGWDDQYAYYPVCAYQQHKDATMSSPIGCAWPSYNDRQYSCGTYWYPFTITVPLLGSDDHWFKDQGGPEYARVLLSRGGQGLYTASGDESYGPSDASACFRSRIFTNTAVAPLTYFNGPVPTELLCSGAQRSVAGCPFTCTNSEGCDASYGRTQNEFYDYAHRVNLDYQDTSKTLYDHYGPTAASGPPSGDWGYAYESGTCVGGSYNGWKCDTSANCPGGYCNQYWQVMRRSGFTYDSLNVRRGESRRSSQVEAWVKMKYADYNNQEIGLVSRWYDANNYFVFMVREIGGDLARLHRYNGGVVQTVAGPNYTPLDLTYWNRLAFKVVDLGSYVQGGFAPNGNCAMSGLVNGSTVVSTGSTPCGNAPYGNYGVFSYYNSSPQFWDLDALACSSAGVCY